jgi:hypothetical protein
MGSLDEADEEEEEELCSANGLPSSRSREQMLETWCVCELRGWACQRAA